MAFTLRLTLSAMFELGWNGVVKVCFTPHRRNTSAVNLDLNCVALSDRRVLAGPYLAKKESKILTTDCADARLVAWNSHHLEYRSVRTNMYSLRRFERGSGPMKSTASWSRTPPCCLGNESCRPLVVVFGELTYRAASNISRDF
jgi:hypothetical protein